jgi:signal transduction histidine kinase
MLKSLHIKLALILILLIASLMAVTGIFLVNGVARFYMDEFSGSMSGYFNGNQILSDALNAALDSVAPADRISEIISSGTASLGIDGRQRLFFILDGAGIPVAGPHMDRAELVDLTPNILSALAGRPGYAVNPSDKVFDCAVPVGEGAVSYIVYICDLKESLRRQTAELVRIVIEAVALGLVISILLSFILSKTLVTPIENLTRSASRVAAGDFSHTPEVHSGDELSVLTRTFNNMSQVLKKALDEQKQLDEIRREFVSNVSHELRTPLTNVRSYAETLLDADEINKKDAKTFLGVILSESDRMTRLVRDLLTLSKFDYDKMDWRVSRVDFGEILTAVGNAMRLEAERRRHGLTLRLAKGLPVIYGDRERLEQVFFNIVSNAIYYTPDGGDIAVSAAEDSGDVRVVVKDNGIGIPAEDLPRVFERFYRVDKARSRSLGGTGLGLSIAREIVKKHHGDITVESESGKGTVVTVRLPVALNAEP